MARGFNLTAEINLRGPSNIRQITSNIRRQLGNINANINLNIDRNASRTITQVNNNLRVLTQTLGATTTAATNATTAFNNLAAAMRAVGNVNLPATISTPLVRTAGAANNASRAIAQARTEFEDFGRQAGLAVRRFAAFASVTSVIYGVTNALAKGVQQYIEFDRQIVRLSQVTNESRESLSGMVQEITKLATNFGVSSSDISQVAVTLAQAGLTAKDTRIALEALAKSALAPSFDSLSDTVEGSIALMRQFGISAGQLENALGSVNSVAAAFAVEAGDIITAIQRTGGVFAAASKGVSEGTDALNEFIAVFTSVRATTRESAETIATGLRTIFTRIQRGDTVEALKEFGVTLTDLEGKFVGPYEAVRRLSEGLSRLDPRDLKFSSIVEELGGFRQIGKVLPLIQQFSTAQEALKVAQQGQGSLATDAAKGQMALAVQIQKVREEFSALVRSLGDSKGFQTLVRLGLDLASALIKVADATKGVLPLIAIMGAFRGASALTQFAGGFGGGFRGNRQRARDGGVIGFARGGLVPGSGDSDSVNARLTPGEFVMRKSAVRSIGVGNLGRMNKYAKAGLVKEELNNLNSNTVKSYFSIDKNINPKDIAQTNIKHVPITLNVSDFKKMISIMKETEIKRLANIDKFGKQEIFNMKSPGGEWPAGNAFQQLIIQKGIAKGVKTPTNFGSPQETLQDIEAEHYADLDFTTGDAKFVKTINSVKAKQLLSKRFRSSYNERKLRPRPTPDIETFVLPTTSVYYPDDGLKDKFNNWLANNSSEWAGEALVSYDQSNKGYNIGGVIQKFKGGGETLTLEKARDMSRKDILDILSGRKGGISTTEREVGVSSGEIYTILGQRNPDAKTQGLKEAILQKAVTANNRQLGAAKAQTTKLQNNNLEVAAAGLFGSKFADQNIDIESPSLSQSAKVRVISGIMDSKIASSFSSIVSETTDKLTTRLAEAATTGDILAKLGLGKELNTDFDRTLVTGADKILSDPGKPVFSEFSDPNKVSAALQGAELTYLGSSLVELIKQRKDLLQYIRVVTARPESTLGLIQGFLASKDLPIPRSQFKGFGGENISADEIAELKAAFLNPDSLFVDDDPRNIAAAKKRSNEGITSYLYGTGKSLPNSQAQGDIEGLLLEQVVQKLGGPGALKGMGFDFPNGLGDAAKYFGLPDDIPTDVKRTISGPSTIKDNIVTYLKNVMGYAGGGTVPAMVSNGEAYVPPAMAKKIGYGKLRKMNQADRNGMNSFASGGMSIFKGSGTGTSDSIGPIGLPVGSFILREKATKALGLNSGGRVQKFLFGGRSRGPAARPDAISVDTIGASSAAIGSLQGLATVLNDLGVVSSRSSQLLSRGYQATAAEAQRAYEADLVMARAAGASADVLYDLEQALIRTRQEADAEVAVMRELADVSGIALQDTLSGAEAELNRLTEAARNAAAATGLTGEELETEVRAGAGDRRRQAFENVAAGGGLTGTSLDLSSIGANGADLERIINNLMRDAETLEQMNARYIQNRREEISQAAIAAGNIARAARIRAGSERDVEETIQREIRARTTAVEQNARSTGARGPDEAREFNRQNNMLASFAVMTVGNIIADTINAKSSATEAGIAGGIRGGTQAFAYANQISGELTNFADGLSRTGNRFAGLASNIARFAGKVQIFAVLGEAAIQAYNGIRQFGIELEKNRVEQALSGLTEQFDKLNKDLNQLDLRNAIQSNIIDASRSSERLRSQTLDTASAGWINGIDVFVSSLQNSETNNTNRRAALRSQVLEKEGIMEYLKTSFGDADTYASKAAKYSGQQALESSQSFKPVADNINQLISARIRGGENIGDILGGPEFKDFATSLVYADSALNKHIREIELSTRYTEEEKKARIDEIISIQGANKIRTQAAIAQREKDQRELGTVASVYTRSLKRMFTNMEQAINAAAYSLKQMTDNIDLNVSALQGQAKVGSVDLQTSNIIQNPRAYNPGVRSSAQASASSLFGTRAPEMAQLMNLGETVENTVMSTINKTLEDKGPDASNEAIARAVDKSVRDELSGLGLPPELADKLAKEVGDTLVDLRKSGDEKFDFAKLSEKLGSLSSVIDTAKDAQQAAIRALENYQNVLNAYANNINRIIDLETSARDKFNKSVNIATDGSTALSKALGRTITVADAFAKRDASIARQTGGLTDPTDIFNKILSLNNDRDILQSSSRQSADKGPAGIQDFIKFNSELKNTSIALRENRAALEDMATNTEKASSAMDAIQEAQQKAAGRIGFLEKVVTSTPDELDSLNQSLYRLQRNMNGQQNTIQNSIGAQKAYRDALDQGASAAESMRAAQTAFANERKETLGTLQDIMPFLGDNQQANNIKANVLETMLAESGMGVSPLFQQILNTLRNPEQDPATAAAIQYYNQSIAEQSTATRLLGQLDQQLANDIAVQNSKLIVDGLTKTVLTFQNNELRDIADKVNTIVSIMQKAPGAGGLASGGMVYAAGGQFINFQPKGTDTVPAMLTPGEFVVNRAATQANLPLLKSINNGYSRGGKVSYYTAGGFVTNWGSQTNMDEFGMMSDKEIIDPSIEANRAIWSAGYKQNIRFLPNYYTLDFASDSTTIPSAGPNFNLDQIKPTNGKVRTGATVGIRRVGDDQYSYIDNQDAIDASQNTPFAKIAETDLYLGLDKFASTKVAQSKTTDYIDKFKTFEKLDATLHKSIAMDPGLFADDLPKASDFTSKADEWNPTLAGKSYGIAFDTAASIRPTESDVSASPSFKIWYYKRNPFNPAGWAPGLAMGVSVKQPQFAAGTPYSEAAGFARDSFDVFESGKHKSAMYPDLTGMKDVITGKHIKDANDISNDNYALYENTVEFLKGGSTYKDADSKRSALQNKLSSLYNGLQPFIQLDINELAPLDELVKLNATSAIIAQQSLEQQFKDGLQYVDTNAAMYNKVKIGLTGAKPAIKNPDFLASKPFDITDTATKLSKSFPFMINGDMKILGKDFEDVAAQQAAATKGKVHSRLLPVDELKVNLPVNIQGKQPQLSIPIAYEEYTGELFDPSTNNFDGKPFTTLLPNNISETLFQNLDESRKRLFTTKKYTVPDILKASKLDNPANPIFTDIIDLFKFQTNNDPNVDAQAKKVAANLNLVFDHPQNSLIKNVGLAGDGGVDVFSAMSDEPTTVNVGEFLLKKFQEFRGQLASGANKVDPIMPKGAVFSDAELPQATAALIRGSMALFGGLKLPGAPYGWLSKSGGPQALRAAISGNPVAAAQHMAGVLNQAGAYVSQLQNRAPNVSAYNALDNAMTMISGAANAFSSLAGGDTSLLKQFYENKVPIAAVFRSLGAASRFGKISGMKLSPDWQNILGNQLQGSKLKTVGRDGSLSDATLVSAIPENATVSDLVKVIFNPYNEFAGKDIRTGLIQKFGDDIFNLRGPNRMPYFDPQTLSFIRTGLYRLMDWYGGKGNWVGQDYFFDEKNEPDNALRMANFAQSFKTDGSQFYKDAMEAQTLFGLSNAFGALPTEQWFVSRGAVLPQKKAAGGVIYAQTGGNLVNFKPQGTDTVPAMLTPGEFVVNRRATQKNLPLLRSINSGASTGYSQGGVVYLSSGTKDPIGANVTGSIGQVQTVDVQQAIISGIRDDQLRAGNESREDTLDMTVRDYTRRTVFKDHLLNLGVTPEQLKIAEDDLRERSDTGVDLPVGDMYDRQIAGTLIRQGISQDIIDKAKKANYEAQNKTFRIQKDLLGDKVKLARENIAAPSRPANWFLSNLDIFKISTRVARKDKKLLEDRFKLTDMTKDDTVNVLDLLTWLSRNPDVQSAANPYISSSDAWMPKAFISGSGGVFSDTTRKQDERAEIEPHIRTLSPQLDTWANVLRYRLDSARQAQDLRDAEAKLAQNQAKEKQGVEAWGSGGAGGIDPSEVNTLRAKQKEWGQKRLQYMERLNTLEGLISLRAIGGTGVGSLEELVANQEGMSTSIRDNEQLGLREDVIDEGNREGLRKGARNLIIGAAIGASAPFLLPAGFVAGAAALTIGGSMGAMYLADMVEEKNYQNLKNTDPKEFARQQLLRSQNSYQEAAASMENIVDIADIVMGLGAGAVTSGFKSKFLKKAVEENAPTKIKTNASTRSAQAQDIADKGKKALKDMSDDAKAKPKTADDVKTDTEAKAKAKTDQPATPEKPIKFKSPKVAEAWNNAVAEARAKYNKSINEFSDQQMKDYFETGPGAAAKQQVNAQIEQLKLDAGVTKMNDADAWNTIATQYPDRFGQFADDLKKNGYMIDDDGNIIFGPNARGIVDSDPNMAGAFENARTKARQQGIDEAADKLKIKKGTRDYDDLVKAYDDDITIKGRTWRGYVKDKWGAVTKSKWARLAAGGAALLAAWQAWMMLNANKQKQQPPGAAPTVPPAPGGSGGSGAGGGGSGGGNTPTVPPLEPTVDPAGKTNKKIENPNYYDELTYKEYASRQMVSGHAPPEPIKKLFTTAAVYGYQTDVEGKRIRGSNRRTTAYDQRDTSGLNKGIGLEGDETGGAMGVKSPVGGRSVSSQTHTTTAPFVPSSTTYDGKGGFNYRPGGAPQDTRNLSEEDKARIKKQGGFLPSGQFGTDQNNKEGNAGVRQSAGAAPAIPFGVRPVPPEKKQGAADEFVESASSTDIAKLMEIANRPMSVRGKTVMSGRTGPLTQYKSAYAFWRRKLGEYNYFNSVAYQKKDRQKKGFGKYDSVLRQEKEAQGLSRGGVVYAQNGMLIPYQPRGTDTVPAMLTPGEFVVNRSATQKHLPLLKTLNRSKGGTVSYLSAGGQSAPQAPPVFVSDKNAAKLSNIGKDVKNVEILSKDSNQLLANNPVPKKIDESTGKLLDCCKDSQNKNQKNAENILTLQLQNRTDMGISTKLIMGAIEYTGMKAEAAIAKASVEKPAWVDDAFNSIASTIIAIISQGIDLTKEAVIDAVGASKAVAPAGAVPGPAAAGAAAAPAAGAAGLYNGGMVYASNGTLINYQPRGTDTVPAMLTPGEFVVNARATKKHLPLLSAINDGNYKADGGIIAPDYYAQGGHNPDHKQWAEARQRHEERQEQTTILNGYKKFGNRAPLFFEIDNQIKQARNLFDALDANAINEDLTKDQVITMVKDKVAKASSDQKAALINAERATAQQRFQYLLGIVQRSSTAIQSLTGNARNYESVQNPGFTYYDILDAQIKHGQAEGKALYEGWLELNKELGSVSLPGSTAVGLPAPGAGGANPPVGKQYGGLIYANNGMLIPYQPKGTDTVPAMLTPGEFVVNRNATRNNLALLQDINSNRFNNGGPVVYKQAGGPIMYRQHGGMTDESGGGTSGVSNSGGPDFDKLAQFTATFDRFIGQLQKLNIPPQINLTLTQQKPLEINVNGAEALQKLLEGPLGDIVRGNVNAALNQDRIGNEESPQ
jgi:TP901 family phage tail tape measure protein